MTRTSTFRRVTPGARVVDGWPLGATELALAAVSVSVALGLRRLFDGWDFLPTVLIATLVAHLVALLTRRAGLGVTTSLLTSAVALVVSITWLEYADTTTWLLPTGRTWDLLGSDLGDAWDAFGVVKAPTEALPGFVVGGAIAMWVLATLADLAAFRARSVAEALVPSGSVFLFTAMLGQSDGRVRATAAFVIAVMGFVLLYRISHPLTPSVPVADTEQRRSTSLLRTGGAVAASAVALGLLAGPLLPGADAAPVVDWKEFDGGSSGPRVTLSPLVDTRGRLVEQTDQVLFRVQSDVPSFWRTTALDSFDGVVWGSANQYGESGGELVATHQPGAGTTITATFTIAALGDIWLPTPYSPTSVEGVDARWSPDSSTLIVRGNRTTTGQTYTVEALSPTAQFDQALLRSASPDVPPDVFQRYTQLPAGFSPDVAILAREITRGADTTFDKALALQNWFRSGLFEYSLDVATGHGNNRMEQFLFEDRRGYCEQFSGSFAAMARSLGIPTRVAVGFTPGEFVDGEYVVRGENYHAWPEVWIDGEWVYFEPTPGRGAPGAEPYTGIPEQQATRGNPNSADTVVTTTPQVPTSGPSGPNLPDLEDFNQFGELGGGNVGENFDTDGDSPAWVGQVLLVLAILAGLATLWVVGVPVARRLLRRRRHARADGPDARIEASWADLQETLDVAGLPADDAETPAEYARRAHRLARLDGPTLESVATTVTTARFGVGAVDESTAAETGALVERLEEQVSARASRGDRFRRMINPRPIVNAVRR